MNDELTESNYVKDDEQVLYKYNNGEVLITTNRVVIGKECWRVEAIRAVDLATLQDYSRSKQTFLRRDLYARIAPPIAVSILGLLLVFFPPFANFEIATFILGILLFLLGLGIGAYIQANISVDVYKIEVISLDAQGCDTLEKSDYTFNYKPPAQKTLLAIRKALKAHNSTIQRGSNDMRY